MIRHSQPSVGQEEAEAVSRVVVSGNIAQGKEVAAFESETAEHVGRKFGVAVSSGTTALHLAMDALGLGTENRIVYPSYACASLQTAVDMQGCMSHIADIGDDYNLDLAQTPDDADAVILPHLFGRKSEIPEGPPVIEDIAQSIGGATGKNSVVAIASFYATKMITTGEGGMVLTDDEGLADHVRDRRDYDNRETWERRYPYKMTDMQAAMGRVQLKKLSKFIARRRDISDQYSATFSDTDLGLPGPGDNVFFRYVIRSKMRGEMERYLCAHGVEAKRPVYRPAHQYFIGEQAPPRIRLQESYPNSDRAHAEVLSLPIHPGMSDEDVTFVGEHVLRFLEEQVKSV